MPFTTQDGKTKAQVAAQAQRGTALVNAAEAQIVQEESDGVSSPDRVGHIAAYAASRIFRDVADDLLSVANASGGSYTQDGSGNGDGSGSGPIVSGTEPANPDYVFALSDTNIVAEKDSNGTITNLGNRQPSSYFPGLGSILGETIEAGEIVKVYLPGVDPGNYDVFLTFGGAAGAVISNVEVNASGVPALVDMTRIADTEVYGLKVLEDQAFSGTDNFITFAVTRRPQLLLSKITLKAA